MELAPGVVSLAEEVNHRVMITGKPETTNQAQGENYKILVGNKSACACSQ